MTIEKITEGSELILKVIGWLDTTTSPDLAKVVESDLGGVTALKFDFSELEYITSAGLRVLLTAQKAMRSVGTMVIQHANESVKEVFEFTGFSDVLTLED